MRFPKVANVITASVIVLGGAGLLAGYVAFGQYAASQQHRADDLRTTVAEKNRLVEKKDGQLSTLLNQYAALAGDCEKAADCQTETPTPTVIEQYISGAPGTPGRSATDDQVLNSVIAYCALRNGCEGPPSMIAGPSGTNGADSSVAGPQGPPGRDGADSTVPGPTGATGPAGADGQPPVSWTYDDVLGMAHTCTRTDPFDATAPTYTCS